MENMPPRHHQTTQVHLCAQCWHYTQTLSLLSSPVCVLFMLIYLIFMSQFIIGDNFCCSDSKTAPCLRNLGTSWLLVKVKRTSSFWLWPGVMIPQFHYKQHHQESLCCFFPTFTWLCKVNLTPRVKLWTPNFLDCSVWYVWFGPHQAKCFLDTWKCKGCCFDIFQKIQSTLQRFMCKSSEQRLF